MARDVVERIRAENARWRKGHPFFPATPKDMDALLSVVEAAKEVVELCDYDYSDDHLGHELWSKLEDALARLYAGSSGES